ncbi:InlB B-repeat-containing protein [Treponema denticola]|uniref:InlB B-repeat-containing protein n=1 Tax=Treponema denticola TaxID=158 RepID=UPI003D8FADC0
MKRLLKILTAAVAVIVLFTACQQFLENPEDFLSYWASEAFVKDHSIGSAHRPDKAGVPCVGSSAPVYITLSVHNPKGFSFVMPTSSAPAGIVEFKELFSQPTAETDYALERTDSGTLKLTYKEAFLQKHEQGLGSLNPTITLKAKDGRVFKQTYTFGIKSNTPPPKPNEIVIAKTNTSPSKYVLCLKFDSDEMTRKIGSGTIPVHKDVREITINNSSYSLLYEGNNLDFKKPSEDSFIEHGKVEKLDSSSPNVPSGEWVLYFNTGVKVESYIPQTSYIITLSDEGGVVSDSVTAELKEKFEVKFDAKGGNPTPNTQYILKGDKVTKPSQDPERMGYIFGGWYKDADCSDGQKWDFGTNTVTSNMTLYAKWTEAKYTVKFRVADGEGKLKGDYNDGSYHSQETQNDGGEVKFENVPAGTQVGFFATPAPGWKVEGWTLNGSPENAYETYGPPPITGDITVTVTFKKVTVVEGTNNFAWKLLKKVVEIADDNAVITINGEIKATYGENAGQIEINTNLTIKKADGAASAVLNANRKSRIFKVKEGKTLTLENLTLTGGKATGTGDAGSGGAIYAKDASTVNITNCIITGNEAGTNGGGLNVEGTPTTITNCIFTGNTAKNGGGIYIMETSTRRPVVTISGGTIGSTDTDKANKATGNGGGIYVGDWCELRLQDSEDPGAQSVLIIGNQAAKGGGVYAKNVLQVSMKNGTRIAVNNDVYLDSGSWIKVFSTLSNNPAARITVPNGKYLPSTKVLDGNAALLNSEHTKFQVTPKGNEHWTVDSNGYLTKDKTAIFNNITMDQIKAAIDAADPSLIYDENNIIKDRTILLGKLVLYKTNNGNYGIMHVTEVNNTSHSGKGHIKFNSKTFNQYGGVEKEETDKVLEGGECFQFEFGGDPGSKLDFYLQNNTHDGSKWFKPLNTAKFYILSN